MLYLRNICTAFVLIPKNASTSIRESLNGEILTGPNDVQHIGISTAIENGLLTINNRFIGVIRNPIERQLSMYLYRQRQKRYSEKLSIEDFRNKIKLGAINDHLWQMQLQSSFMEYNKEIIGELWLYEEVNERFKEFGTLKVKNKSFSGNTKDFIDIFYDKPTLKAVESYWRKDIELYNALRESRNRN